MKRKYNPDHDLYYNVLEDIRQAGICNMFGSTPYLVFECPELTNDEAKEILLEWMENYEELAEKFGWRK